MSDLWLRVAVWLGGLTAVSLLLWFLALKAKLSGFLFLFRRSGNFRGGQYQYWRLFFLLCSLLALALGAIFSILGALAIRWSR